jgi:hypothetical protein
MNFKTVKNVEALKPVVCKNKAVRDPYVFGVRVTAFKQQKRFTASTGLTLFGPLTQRGGLASED